MAFGAVSLCWRYIENDGKVIALCQHDHRDCSLYDVLAPGTIHHFVRGTIERFPMREIRWFFYSREFFQDPEARFFELDLPLFLNRSSHRRLSVSDPALVALLTEEMVKSDFFAYVATDEEWDAIGPEIDRPPRVVFDQEELESLAGIEQAKVGSFSQVFVCIPKHGCDISSAYAEFGKYAEEIRWAYQRRDLVVAIFDEASLRERSQPFFIAWWREGEPDGTYDFRSKFALRDICDVALKSPVFRALWPVGSPVWTALEVVRADFAAYIQARHPE